MAPLDEIMEAGFAQLDRGLAAGVPMDAGSAAWLVANLKGMYAEVAQLTEAVERYQAENAVLRAEVDRLTAGSDRAAGAGPRCLCMRARSSACPVHGGRDG